MTIFLLVSVTLLIIAVAITVASVIRAKDGYEDRAGFHPEPRPDRLEEPPVGRMVTRASSR